MQMLEQLRKKADSNILMYCLFLFASYLFTLIELVTKFATVSVNNCVNMIMGDTFRSRQVGMGFSAFC